MTDRPILHRRGNIPQPDGWRPPEAPLSDRQKLILSCALELFYTNSYHGTSSRDIANAAKMNQATLYHYFKSKEEILFTILWQTAIELHEQVRHASEETARLSPSSRLRAVARAHARYFLANYKTASALHRDIVGLDSVARVIVGDVMDGNHAIFTTTLQEGIELGEFVDIPTDVMTTFMTGAITRAAFLYDPNGPHSLDEIVDHLVDLMMGGVLVRPERTPALHGARSGRRHHEHNS